MDRKKREGKFPSLYITPKKLSTNQYHETNMRHFHTLENQRKILCLCRIRYLFSPCQKKRYHLTMNGIFSQTVPFFCHNLDLRNGNFSIRSAVFLIQQRRKDATTKTDLQRCLLLLRLSAFYYCGNCVVCVFVYFYLTVTNNWKFMR